MGRHTEAEPLLLEALALGIQLGERRHIPLTKLRLAEVYAATGRPDAAKRLVEEVYRLAEELDSKGLRSNAEEIAASLP